MNYSLTQISGKNFLITPKQMILLEFIEYVEEGSKKEDDTPFINILMRGKMTTIYGITLAQLLDLMGIKP